MTLPESAAAEANGMWFEHGLARIWVEESGDAQGPAVLVLPGLAGSIDELSAIREQMAAQGMRVIAADLPGSGKSQPQPRSYSPYYHQEDATAFAALLEEMDALPAVLIGFSDGGDVALSLASDFPAHAKGVLVWGAMGSIDDPDGQVAPFFRNIVDAPSAGGEGFRAYLIETYGREVARASMQSVADALEAIVARGGDISLSRVEQIQCPVLLVAGDGDQFVPLTALNEFNARLLNGRVLVVEGGGHALHVTHPALVADAVHAFLFAIHAYPT